jgi:hypothetical protein
MEGPRPNAYSYGGPPAPYGASPTQPYKCGQYFKVNVNTRRTGHVGVVGATVPVARKRGDCKTTRATGDGRPYEMVLTLTLTLTF